MAYVHNIQDARCDMRRSVRVSDTCPTIRKSPSLSLSLREWTGVDFKWKMDLFIITVICQKLITIKNIETNKKKETIENGPNIKKKYKNK